MGVEIERKFLVDHNMWDALTKPTGNFYRQGYVLSDENRTVRVRVTDDAAYITFKGGTTGISRSEYEYTVPIQDGMELLDGFTTSSIEKVRYKINYAGNIWEVDVFAGENQGLIVAEIELPYEEQEFEKPNWVTKEVSDDSRYTNALLSVSPYNSWKQ